MKVWQTKPAALLLVSLSITSAFLTLSFFTLVRRLEEIIPVKPSTTKNDAKEYTFEGDDFPTSLPVANPERSTLMLVEESVHYSLTDHEAPYEWLYNSPYGTGAVRLGPNNRAFFVSMFHELHCLRYFQGQLITRGEPNWGHVTHCFNYLREMVLCQADLTLEPGDFTKRNVTEDRFGAVHVCRDWEAVYDEMAANWVKWYKYKKQNNLTEMIPAQGD